LKILNSVLKYKRVTNVKLPLIDTVLDKVRESRIGGGGASSMHSQAHYVKKGDSLQNPALIHEQQ
jgi:hypothetical protein